MKGLFISSRSLVFLSATKVMTDIGMKTNTLDLFCFFGFYGDTSRIYFIFHFILLYTLLNRKTLLTSLYSQIPHRKNTFIGRKICKIMAVNTSKFNTNYKLFPTTLKMIINNSWGRPLRVEPMPNRCPLCLQTLCDCTTEPHVTTCKNILN